MSGLSFQVQLGDAQGDINIRTKKSSDIFWREDDGAGLACLVCLYVRKILLQIVSQSDNNQRRDRQLVHHMVEPHGSLNEEVWRSKLD